MKPSFSVFALGSGGGPLENNISSYVASPRLDLPHLGNVRYLSYLCKTYDTTWEGNVFALEAGLYIVYVL